MSVRKFLAVLVVTAVLGAPSLAVASSGPMDRVRVTVDAILGMLKDDTIDQEVRREKISSLIRERFDFAVMAQRILATRWKKASPEEQAKFVDLFSGILEASYIGKIEAYTDERVDYVKEEVKKKRAVVDTLIITKSTEIPIQYKMLQRGEDWRVYDVIVEEISLVNNYRTTYREIARKEGFDGLLTRMEEKLKELKALKEQGQTT